MPLLLLNLQKVPLSTTNYFKNIPEYPRLLIINFTFHVHVLWLSNGRALISLVALL